jgi:uncharacterized membrane protein
MPAIVFLVLDKNAEVRRSAVQSIVAHGILAGLYWIAMPLLYATVVLAPLGVVISGLTGVGYFIASLVAVARAHAGKQVVWPLISEWTEKILKVK